MFNKCDPYHSINVRLRLCNRLSNDNIFDKLLQGLRICYKLFKVHLVPVWLVS